LVLADKLRALGPLGRRYGVSANWVQGTVKPEDPIIVCRSAYATPGRCRGV